MRYAWFRVYHDIITDHKLRRLPPWTRWFWVVLMTVASMSSKRGTILDMDEHDLADAAGLDPIGDDAVTPDAVRWAIHQFVTKRMLRKVKRGWVVANFKTRQYDKPSDYPERVRGRVAKVRQVKRPSNARVSPDVTRKKRPGNGQRREEERKGEKTRIERSTPLAQATNPPSPSGEVFAFWDQTLAVSPKDLREWSAAYPAVDVMTCIRAAAAWAKANPERRKRNIRRFVVNWLAREQERGGTRRTIPGSPNRESPYLPPPAVVGDPQPELTDEQRVENLRRVASMTREIATAKAVQ